MLEDLRVDDAVDNRLDRVRIVVNPFDKWTSGEKWTREVGSERINENLAALYTSAVNFYRQYRDNPDRQWNHWAFRYIEYFGPRTFIPLKSAFI
jgi:hypothetical protein